QEALHKAGLSVPATGFNYPVAMKDCISYETKCLLVGVPPWISGDAMRLATDILDGKVKGPARFVPFLVPLFQTKNTTPVDTKNLGKVYELKKVFTAKT